MRVAVLGGDGFLGAHVMQQLNAAGVTAAPFSRRSGCNLLYFDSARQSLDYFQPTHIVDCAGDTGSIRYASEFAAEVVDRNMTMLLNVFKLANELGAALVNPIAGCAYPGNEQLYREGRFWNGPIHETVLSFGSTRRMIDVLSTCYRRQHGLLSSMFFVPSMYGPGGSADPLKTHAFDALVVKALRARKEGLEELEVWGSGKPVREWMFVEDCARFVVELLMEGRWNLEPVNLAWNQGISINELARVICNEIGFKGKIVNNTELPDGAPIKLFDNALFRSRYPNFKLTPILKGLPPTIAYYEKLLG